MPSPQRIWSRLPLRNTIQRTENPDDGGDPTFHDVLDGRSPSPSGSRDKGKRKATDGELSPSLYGNLIANKFHLDSPRGFGRFPLNFVWIPCIFSIFHCYHLVNLSFGCFSLAARRNPFRLAGEYLNALPVSGFPPHSMTLKLGSPSSFSAISIRNEDYVTEPG